MIRFVPYIRRFGAFFFVALTLAVLLIFLSSCVGVKSRVTVNKDGTGTITLDWRLRTELARFGDVSDGALPPVPLSRLDFERGIARLPGLTLKKWAAKTDGADTLYHAEMAFDSLDTLVLFLDAQAAGDKTTEWALKDGKTTLKMTLANVPAEKNGENAALEESFREFFDGYDLEMEWLVPKNAHARVNNDEKATGLSVSDKKVVYKNGMADLLFAKSPTVLEISWSL